MNGGSPVLIVGTFRVPVDRIAAARAPMEQMVQTSRAEPGCLVYAYAADLFDAGLIHVIERWEDQASLDRHATSDHIKAWRAAWPALVIGERDLTLYANYAARPA